MKVSRKIEYIKEWILKYCKSMLKPANSLVVGVSGGIDSSVVSTICAMTGKRTFAVSMPIQQNKEQHIIVETAPLNNRFLFTCFF